MTNLENYLLDYGYCEGSKIINKDEINYLRTNLEKSFEANGYPTTMSLFDINDKNLVKNILNIFSCFEVNNFISILSEFCKEQVSLSPKFMIHRNYHVDRFKTPGIGWHRDCGGELKYKYCNKYLSLKSYFFGKLGIYLQENSEYGGSIDVIPSSHKYIKYNNYFLRKINGSRLFFLKIFQKYFSFFYQLISEKLFMKILKAKTLKPKIGSFVIFDSRLVHRGTPISDSVRKKINFDSMNYSAQGLPLEKIKFALYVDLGTPSGLDSYLFDRNQRPNQKKEIDILIHDLKKVNSYYPELANKMENVFLPIMNKYTSI